MRRSHGRSAAVTTANPAVDSSHLGNPVRAPSRIRTTTEPLPVAHAGVVGDAGSSELEADDHVRDAAGHQAEREAAEHVERRVRPQVDACERHQPDHDPRERPPGAAQVRREDPREPRHQDHVAGDERAEADIAVVDLKREMTLDDATLQSRAKITPWHGRKVIGLPIHTIVRGRFVMRDRALVEGTRGHGRSVHAIQQMPAPAPRNVDQSMTSITRVPARPTESAA